MSQIARVVQEALANVAKHAGAGRTRVSLRADQRVTLQVHDDGAGFSTTSSADPLGDQLGRDRWS